MASDSTSGFQWLAWGVGAAVLYIVVSNTLYLLLGARLLQFLPGVNVKGFRGTLRLALLLAVSVAASVLWAGKRALQSLTRRQPTLWKDEIARGVQLAAKISDSMTAIVPRRRGSR